MSRHTLKGHIISLIQTIFPVRRSSRCSSYIYKRKEKISHHHDVPLASLCSALLCFVFYAFFFHDDFIKFALALQGLATPSHACPFTHTHTHSHIYSECDSWSVRVTSLSFRLPRPLSAPHIVVDMSEF